MAAQRKRARKAPAASTKGVSAHEFTVVLEEIRAQNKVFGEGLNLVREQMLAGFEEMNRRFDQVDRRFEQVDARFEQIDRRFEQVDGEIARLKEATVEHGRQLKELRADLREFAAKKVDRDEVEEIVDGAVARRGAS